MRLTVLAGDVGGTNTRLALFEGEAERLELSVIEVFPSREFVNLDAIVRKFMKSTGARADFACFGVAGPVKEGICEAPNLAWVVDSTELAKDLGLESVALINDLEANAYGIDVLGEDDFTVLNSGAAVPGGNRALISAGTGLGEAGLHWLGDRYRPVPTEGGHADFSPRNKLETELLLYLLKRYERVSYERVVSGPGIFNIYSFLRDTGRCEEPGWLAELLREEDPPAVISRVALEGRSELCMQALDLFVSLYAAEAGNLALRFLATGGLFVGGGIAPRIIEKLKGPSFMTSFVAKGRMKSLLEAIPVCVILNDQAALLGAARLASIRLSGSG